MTGTIVEINNTLLKQYKTKPKLPKKDQSYIMDEYFFLTEKRTYKNQLMAIGKGKGLILHFHVTDIYPNATISLEAIDVNII